MSGRRDGPEKRRRDASATGDVERIFGFKEKLWLE
jgi:hypothetical protein